MYFMVTPCVGVWIEILKANLNKQPILVTPCVGVWIEILISASYNLLQASHSLCGSVD